MGEPFKALGLLPAVFGLQPPIDHIRADRHQERSDGCYTFK
jgi:hypothetical protein